MKTSTHIKTFLAGIVIAGTSLAAVAQTTNTSPSGTNQAPTGVGVTPQTAAEANRNAVPRSDTGTVVRTGPNAADAARSSSGAMQGSTPNTTGNNSNMSGSDTNMGSTGSASGSNGTTMRTARADRN